ncbi:MAG: UPF0175 family protein [Bryobacterales bacterium]|nr:UPF0175 family protein [Bryobacterales bacterium]
MKSVAIHLPESLVQAAQLNPANPSSDAARLLALELFREEKVSLGRAAELCEMALEDFMTFAAERDVSLHYGMLELEEDRETLRRIGL